MRKLILIFIMILLMIPTTASVLACEPTATPRPTKTAIPPTLIPPTHEPPTLTGLPPTTIPPTATNPPRKHKTPVPPVYRTATPNACMSDCEFKRLVIQLLMQILAEVRK
jgi:hypothetical protein